MCFEGQNKAQSEFRSIISILYLVNIWQNYSESKNLYFFYFYICTLYTVPNAINV